MTTRYLCKLAALALAVALVASLAGCATEPNDNPQDKLAVTVSIVPQQYFVQRIGGDLVSVNVMVEPGASPATYEPKPAQLTALADSAAYFSIGVPFENAWLDRIADANPDMQMVDTIEGIKRLPMTADHDHDEEDDEHEADHEDDDDHDADHDHEDGAEENGSAIVQDNADALYDPHVWLSPSLVAVQARTIALTLGGLDPANVDVYTANLNVFLQELETLDADIRETLADVEGEAFMVFHPSWGYFAADYGMEQIAVEIGGQEPSAQELAALIDEAKHEEIQVVFAQPEFSTKAAETIADEIGGEVLLISPLALDWMDNMRTVADAFADTLGD